MARCFWGVEHIFLKHYPPAQNKGILRTTVGYTGGNPAIEKPSYEVVCSGQTDHAESVKIEFNPSVVSYAAMVEFFYRTHDPTTVNAQGGDAGTRECRPFLSIWIRECLLIMLMRYQSTARQSLPTLLLNWRRRSVLRGRFRQNISRQRGRKSSRKSCRSVFVMFAPDS